MVKVILDTYTEDKGVRNVTLSYNVNNAHDQMILHGITRLLSLQPKCYNCVNYEDRGTMCGYHSHGCKIHGDIEAWDHPHHDGDGSKCPDYEWNGDM